ncbi:UNVERIFIED_CONTAM: hypothetical protein Slati_1144300 [Sesamum latifolium]|uniref:Uncharacterized protein n=1 Tax=Sesamum latifolium TaxID=2727402 RepID=A0AAW2XBT5_9LAMI
MTCTSISLSFVTRSSRSRHGDSSGGDDVCVQLDYEGPAVEFWASKPRSKICPLFRLPTADIHSCCSVLPIEALEEAGGCCALVVAWVSYSSNMFWKISCET